MSPALKTGLALAGTVAFAYATCALFFWLLPQQGLDVMTALFHGVDFSGLMAKERSFRFDKAGLALVVLTAWAFVLGTLFGWLRGR